MAQYVARLNAGVRVPPFARSMLFVAQMVALGLVAIGVSGVACGLVRYRYGDHTLALDSQSPHLSASRCADLTEYHPEKTTCAAAELAHHADEVVEYRLAAGVLGLLGFFAYAVVRARAQLSDDEARAQRARFLRLATGAFGLGAVVLLTVGTRVLLGSGDAAARWFTDGAVSLAFFLISAGLLVTSGRLRPQRQL